MKTGLLKFAEIFAILAMFFLLIIVVLTQDAPIYIVSMDDSEGNNFQTASAVLKDDFLKELDSKLREDIIPKIERHNYNVMEIIGHTDTGRFTFDKNKNWTKEALFHELDKKMAFDTNVYELVNTGTTTISPPNNPSLGLMRALAVRHFFIEKKKDYPVLRQIKYFLPYTGGQFVDLDYSIAKDYVSEPDDDLKKYNSRLRRIEIRLSSDSMWKKK